jgi:D-serine deaminase-like pyridoxal phosphate-dependent protein
VPASKTTTKNTKAKKSTASKAKAKKPSASKATAKTSTPSRRASSSRLPARPGDLIVLDSPQVGSPAREGEILKVTVGAFSVSYQVRRGDGRETTISPGGGTARIIRS